MGLSILDLFKVGIGPSSSHTVGPMVAANRFLAELQSQQQLEQIYQIVVELYGSLAMTGIGHATDIAVMLGLLGEKPDQLDPDQVPDKIKHIRQSQQLELAGRHPITFDYDQHLQFIFGQNLPKHPNAMTIKAMDSAGIILHQNNYYSVGGGFVLSEDEAGQTGAAFICYHSPSF